MKKKFVSLGKHISQINCREIEDNIYKGVVFVDAGKYYYSFHHDIQFGYSIQKYKKYKYKDALQEDVKWYDTYIKFIYHTNRLISMYQRV